MDLKKNGWESKYQYFNAFWRHKKLKSIYGHDDPLVAVWLMVKKSRTPTTKYGPLDAIWFITFIFCDVGSGVSYAPIWEMGGVYPYMGTPQRRVFWGF
jgi:hypothetical protein